jgi:hypothetical protein
VWRPAAVRLQGVSSLVNTAQAMPPAGRPASRENTPG